MTTPARREDGVLPLHPSHLALEELEVRRMPGFRRGGFTFTGLSPGVNVIYGSNGAGKTTTARAIEALFWPEEAGGPEVSLFARFRLDGASWTVDLDMGRRTCQREGVPVQPPPVPPGMARDRYRLSLTELVQVDDGHFAAHIARESAGGYDIARALETLGFQQSLQGVQKAVQELQRARQRLQETREQQKALLEQEERLRVLERSREEAAAAADRAAELERVIACLKAREAEEELRRELEHFPPWLERLTGNELDRLEAIRRRLGRAGSDREQAASRLEAARRKLSEAGLPGDGLPHHRFASLRRTLDALREADRTARQAAAEREQARVACMEEERRLGDGVQPERLATLGLPGLQDLHALAGEYGALQARRLALEAELRHLEQPGPAATGVTDTRRLQEGIALLSRWLRAGGAEGAAAGRRLAVAAMTATSVALLLAGASLVAAAAAPPGGTAALVLVGLAAGWGTLLALGREQGARDPRVLYRRAFEESGLAPPAAWTEEGVGQRLQALQRELAEAEAQERRRERREAVEKELAELQEKEAPLVARRGELAARLGLPPGTAWEGLLWVVERVGSWQTAARRLREAEERLRQEGQRRDELLQQLAAELVPLGYEGLASVEAVQGALEDLEHRRGQWEEARRETERALEDLQRAEREREAAEAERRTLFEQLELDPAAPGVEAVLEREAGQLPRYRQLREEWALARRQVQAAEAEAGEGLLGRWGSTGREELERLYQEARAHAAEAEQLKIEGIQIRTLVDEAKRGHALEGALADYEAARAQLQELFRRSARAALGRLLAGVVQQESRDSQRPAVFHRARQLFARITAGRYRLELDEGAEHGFRAVESESGEGRSLDELSSGTRVQLLLSVRVAFAELLEHGVRLPLSFDEVLANSDDTRARAVMEAVVALAGEGRQIFYFTAQHDEVAKWRAALEGSGVAHSFIDLDRLRRGEEATRRPLPDPAPPARVVPVPAGVDHEGYGRLLHVPGIDPFQEDLGSVHLWHLLERPEELYPLLAAGVERWGALQALAEAGALDTLGEAAPALYGKAATAARALEAIVRGWRVGRGRPVEPQALVQSGIVSAAFLDRLTELLRRCDGDSRRFLAALENREVPRFRQDKVAELRRYLEEQGYVDSREPLSPDRLRAAALAAVAGDAREGRISQAHLERLLRAVLGAGGAREKMAASG